MPQGVQIELLLNELRFILDNYVKSFIKPIFIKLFDITLDSIDDF